MADTKETEQEIIDDTNETENSGLGADLFDMSDEEFTKADDNGELDVKEDNTNSNTNTKSDEDNSEGENNVEEETASSEGEDDESTDEDSSTKQESVSGSEDQDSVSTDANQEITTQTAKPKRKRHAEDRTLSPEEQESVDKNIAEQTQGLTAEDYEKAYKELLKPLWARGHNFTPRNIEEVKTLMSQGVDYLYKTQQLAQHRKQIELLQREGISDEDLTFLIDLKKKDPEAIKKLLTDGNINPYDIDTSEAPNYQPKTQMVSDATLNLRDSVNNLLARPDGRACYDELVNTLDKESQDYFLKEPELLETFYEHQHINVGNNKSLYTIIKEEIDHAKALGQLPHNMPFLDAYRTVGDNLLRQTQGQAASQPSRAQVNSANYSATAPEIHQRLGSVRNKANVTDRVKAAGVSPKTKSNRSKPIVNPFDMPDDEFLKQFEGRL